jgi:hypothetical protein
MFANMMIYNIFSIWFSCIIFGMIANSISQTILSKKEVYIQVAITASFMSISYMITTIPFFAIYLLYK